jgi:leucyl aminopeptidase
MLPLSPKPFETSVVAAVPAGYETPLLALALPRGPLPPSLAGVDKQTGGAIGRVLVAGDFTGKKDETAVIYPSGPAARVLLVGLGKPDEIDRTAIRRAAAGAAKRARSLGVPVPLSTYQLKPVARSSLPTRASRSPKVSPRAPGSTTR